MVSAIDRARRSLVALLQLGEALWRCAGADAARPCLFANFARLEAVLDVSILAQIASKPVHVSGKRDCTTILSN